MDSVYLTVNSMGRLAPTLLTGIIFGYLLTLRGKTIRTYLLAGYFGFLSLFNFGHLWAYSVFDPAGRWGWYLVSAIAFALIFKTRFAYNLPDSAYPKEERIAFWATLAMASLVWLEYVYRAGLSSRFYFENQFYGAPFVSTTVPVLAFLLFAWSMVVLLRQSFQGGAVQPAALGFLALTLLELTVNAVVLLQRFEVIPEANDVIALGINVTLLLLFFAYALLYLNLSSEPSSFVAKLVGISLVTVMVVISTLGLHQVLQAEYAYDRERTEDMEAAVRRGISGRPINLPGRLGRDASGHRHPGAVRYIARIDASSGSGQLLYSLEPEFKYPARPPAADGAPVGFDRQYRQLGDQIYVVFQARANEVLPDGDRSIYEVGFDYRAYRHEIHQTALSYCYATLITVAFMLLVFPLFFRATVTGPMRQLLGILQASTNPALQPAGAGDPASPNQQNELARLSQTFAEMMGVLKDAKSRFYEYSDHLEEIERIISAHGPGQTQIRAAGDRSLLYSSQAMHEVVAQVDRFAGFTRPVLINGETGTGKELIARLIHHAGPRGAAPFVAVNCAAIPTALWESEIFGHIRGAFTDASSNRPGRVDEAGEGTLFFDEIGEMPLEMQAKMLRLLQERSYHRVGSDEARPARCRFVFATNRDLSEMTATGLFREDLYYRINVFQVVIPPLRERRADIPVLVEHILHNLAREAGYPGGDGDGQPSGVTADRQALTALLGYEWPGNIRELENVLVRSLAVSGAEAGQRPLQLSDLPPLIQQQYRPPIQPPPTGQAGEMPVRPNRPPELQEAQRVALGKQSFDERLRGFSRELIDAALRETGGNQSRAAELLQMKRNRLRYQMKELGFLNDSGSSARGSSAQVDGD